MKGTEHRSSYWECGTRVRGSQKQNSMKAVMMIFGSLLCPKCVAHCRQSMFVEWMNAQWMRYVTKTPYMCPHKSCISQRAWSKVTVREEVAPELKMTGR